MESLQVMTYGFPVPILEALALAATESDIILIDESTEVDPDRLLVALIYCDTAERWEVLGDYARGGAVAVGVITEITADAYVRALSSGASGVVHCDTSPASIMSVIQSASNGEVVLPASIAQCLAAGWVGSSGMISLTDYEEQLIMALSEGATMCEIANMCSYSERTIRRHLQGAFLKMGASNRFEALQIASRHKII